MYRDIIVYCHTLLILFEAANFGLILMTTRGIKMWWLKGDLWCLSLFSFSLNVSFLLANFACPFSPFIVFTFLNRLRESLICNWALLPVRVAPIIERRRSLSRDWAYPQLYNFAALDGLKNSHSIQSDLQSRVLRLQGSILICFHAVCGNNACERLIIYQNHTSWHHSRHQCYSS